MYTPGLQPFTENTSNYRIDHKLSLYFFQQKGYVNQIRKRINYIF